MSCFADFESMEGDLMMGSGLSVVMATRNEFECIEKVTGAYASVLLKMPFHAWLIVAGCSEDNTLDKTIAAAKERYC